MDKFTLTIRHYYDLFTTAPCLCPHKQFMAQAACEDTSRRYMSIKKIFIVMLLSFPALAIASSNNLSEKEVIELLCSGKWHLSYMEMDGQHLDFPVNEQEANWTKFNTDGTHHAEEMGEAYNGKWTYDHASKTLTTDDKDGVVEFIILSIEDGELKLSLMDQGKEMKVGMKK